MRYHEFPTNQTENYPEGNADGSHLSPLEKGWLEDVPSDGWQADFGEHIDFMKDQRTFSEKSAAWLPAKFITPTMVVAFRGDFGLDMGVVRRRIPAGTCGYAEDSYEVSPFPGAWKVVGISQILLVRHPHTI